MAALIGALASAMLVVSVFGPPRSWWWAIALAAACGGLIGQCIGSRIARRILQTRKGTAS